MLKGISRNYSWVERIRGGEEGVLPLKITFYWGVVRVTERYK